MKRPPVFRQQIFRPHRVRRPGRPHPRLKGLSKRQVLFKHALRNALLPTITIVALDVGYLLGGVIVVEEIFALPGIGRQLIVAIQARDLPSIQAGALIMATTYAVANFLADICYAWLDRRIQYD